MVKVMGIIIIVAKQRPRRDGSMTGSERFAAVGAGGWNKMVVSELFLILLLAIRGFSTD